jgi:hypothetical protein
MLVKYRMYMIVQIWSLIKFGRKIPQFRFILKISLFSVWVPNSEERKVNPRKSYLGVLVWITESLYSGGGTPASGSVLVYAGSRSASSSVSGYESTVSSIINLN